MFVSDVEDKEQLSSLVIKELRDLGIKHRREKRGKLVQDKSGRKNIFRTPLHLLELTDVILANGGIVQIPRFVSEACQRILELVDTEGLFRKAGSTIRQKEIRMSLEDGMPLGRSHHVIDVANVLKLFFRELPDPLIPPTMQETFLRSLLSSDKIHAILMCCLLLPPLTANTLAFFMQFLQTVAFSSDLNKMTIENLAIIFTPGLMPLSEIVGIRFNNHVKVIQLLITNADQIGVLPRNIADKLQFMSSAETLTKTATDEEKKKKKRRSGSLTRMFNGIRKIVGAIGSSENLEDSSDCNQMTPCLTKSAKKRKLSEVSAFSSKKKKDLLNLLPQNGGILPNTPLRNKEPKKSRLSLGGKRHLKQQPPSTSSNTAMERRWSVVGSGWSRKKPTSDPTQPKMMKTTLSPVVSMPCIANKPPNRNEEDSLDLLDIFPPNDTRSTITASEESYVRISKTEYESIKERVSAIETRISQEFGNVKGAMFSPTYSDAEKQHLSGPERVLDKFERTVEETESMSSPGTDQLAKRLSRELKIRRSEGSKVFRSPSARKIGSIRRRSRENVKLSRNKTWHISNKQAAATTKAPENQNKFVSEAIFYPKRNLKRGRPNTIQTGLHQPPPKDDMEWTSADVFFSRSSADPREISDFGTDNNPATPQQKNISERRSRDRSSSHRRSMTVETPKYVTTIAVNDVKTPMLPPSSIPRKATLKTPSSVQRSVDRTGEISEGKVFFTPLQENQQGRASIARLRSQNAGMVMAKAKLFDGLQSEVMKPNLLGPRQGSYGVPSTSREKFEEHSKIFKKDNDKTTPRSRKNPSKSPGCVQKRQKTILQNTTHSTRLPAMNDQLTVEENVPSPLIMRQMKFNNKRSVQSPRRNNIKMKKHLHSFDSPVRISKTPRKMNSSRTPLRATQPHHNNYFSQSSPILKL